MDFQFREDGYFNMTNAAKHFGKRLAHFWENAGTQEYMVSLAEALGVREPDFRSSKSALSDNRRGRGVNDTYAHPKLAVFFARWLDVKFAV